MNRNVLLIAAIAALPILIIPSQSEAGQRCRTYTKTINVDGHREIGYGKACQLKNGLWEIVKVNGSYEGRERLKRHIVDDLYDRGYELTGYNDGHAHYGAHAYSYHNARYYSGYPYDQPRNYGQYKKHRKHSYKHKPRVHYHDGKKCSARH